MMTLDNAWTREQDDILRDNPHVPRAQLTSMVNAVGPKRYVSSVRGRISRLARPIEPRTSDNRPWSSEERAIIVRLAPTMTDQGIVAALAERGLSRSPNAVKRARHRYKLTNIRQPVERQDRDYIQGWGPLPGDPATRDREFVRRVIAEGLRLGLYRKAA